MSSLAATLTQPNGQSTRRIEPRYKPWTPHRYQQRGIEFLCTHTSGALFWDPGLGKTATVLEAFRRLKEETNVRRMLVVAPLRVCQLVWRQEGEKWTQFRDLSFTLLHGPKKDELLREDTDIHLINPEGVAWLTQQFFGKRKLPYDVVCIDELTRFKNHRAQRSKRLRKKIEDVPFRWGLTGTPAPNGYMDLFGQILMLDGGKALGPAITYFRDLYFIKGFNGFDWDLKSGSDKKIEAKIAPLVLRMAAEDYLELPPLTDNLIQIEMPPAAKKAYEEMKADLIISLPEGYVTAANSGVVYAKLKQLTNGAVYYEEGMERAVAEVHTAKIDALKDLIEELAGQPLLVAYEFQHDLERLRHALGEDTPALAGMSEKRVTEVTEAWNRGEVPVLLVHPASAGHGLNLQAAAGQGTAHVCWFSLPWDLELYDQTLRRVYRQGSEASHVINHILMVDGGMDKTAYEALQGKDTTQGRLLQALNAEVLRDDPAPIATGSVANTEEDSVMVKKLGFKGEKGGAAKKGWGAVGVTEEDESDLPPTGDEDEEEEEEQPKKSRKPKGWGATVASDDDDDEEEEETQPQRIRSKVRAPEPEEDEEEEEESDEDEEEPPAVRARKAFSKGVVEQLEEDGDEEEEEPAPKKTKKSRAKKTTIKRGQDVGKDAEPEEAEEEKPADGRFASKKAEERWHAQQEQVMLAGLDKRTAAPTIRDAEQVAFPNDVPVEDRGGAFTLSIHAEGIPRGALADVFESLAVKLRGN